MAKKSGNGNKASGNGAATARRSSRDPGGGVAARARRAAAARSQVRRRHRHDLQGLDDGDVPGRQGAGRRPERAAGRHRRLRLRPVGDVRRADPDAQPRSARQGAACATRASTPPRSARRRARRCSPAATTTAAAPASSPSSATASPATPARSRRAARWARRCCARTATAPRSSARTTTSPTGRPACRGRSTAGRPARGSTTSTVSSAASRTSGSPPCTRTPGRSSWRSRRGAKGLHAQRGARRPRHRVHPPAEVGHARPAVLRLLRARRHARAPPRPQGVDRQVQGPVRSGLGQVPRGDASRGSSSWA